MFELCRAWLIDPFRLDALAVTAQSVTFDASGDLPQAFLNQVSGRSEGTPVFIRDGKTARIPIMGTLTDRPSFFLDMFGGGQTVYGDIRAALAEADSDPDIDQIVLEINSGGGTVAGFHDTAMAIRSTGKPVEAQVTDLAASSAYGLAAQADAIVANNPMAMIGSVGVVAALRTSDGLKVVRSKNAPLKQPDDSTPAGIKQAQLEVNELEAQFISLIAEGRGTSVKAVQTNFGRGGMLLAADAKSAGMIDSVRAVPERVRESTNIDDAPTGDIDDEGAEAMTITVAELQAKYPGVFDEVRAIGVKAERARCSALLAVGKTHKALDDAAKFIEGGQEFNDPLVGAAFMNAGLKLQQLGVLADESDDEKPPGTPPADAPTAAAAALVAQDTFDDAVCARTNALLGIDPPKSAQPSAAASLGLFSAPVSVPGTIVPAASAAPTA